MKVPAFISQKTTIKTEKMWQFYLSVALWSVVYATMNVSIVVFLEQQFGSYFLAGLAIAIGNFCSMFFDIPFNYLQKIFSARKLFLTSIISVASAILLFIFLVLFIDSVWIKMIFLFLATIIFSVSYDLYNITVTSYVMEKSSPAQYGQNLSYKQLAQAVGLIGGLIVSAVLIFAANVVQNTAEFAGAEVDHSAFLAATSVVLLFLFCLLIVLFVFALFVFDKEDVDANFRNVLEEFPSNLSAGFRTGAIKTIDMMENNLEKLKDHLKPNQVYIESTQKKKSFMWTEIKRELSTNLSSIISIFTAKQKNYSLLWGTVVMTIFSFWDTYLATFQPAFMNDVMQEQKNEIWGILPGNIVFLIILLPAFFLLTPFAKWGDKYGKDFFVILGMLLTAVSCLLMGWIDLTMFVWILFAGWGLAIGYAAAISCVKASFATKFNEYIAIYQKKNTIDSNASAGPMMMVENFGNIIGPLLGGAIISLMSFQVFFILFGLMMLILTFLSFLNFKKITAPPYIFPDSVGSEELNDTQNLQKKPSTQSIFSKIKD